ncbi:MULTISPECIES: hypothetical protein [unclassified Haematospirillum]|uniref:hypothetical protein n=1 Tax=unclassified Haematospirillum TaxID=2622088 RepID=UPI00143C951E|nr:MULTISPECIES: hypothetical protein [unclassified Haematospirillum]NKD55322.1 hypothetical protein [Haematospirillum sp. H4890]NKD75541.1 hypothetical protein [Haematospirillum sp. H4485]NKD88375.1 hypothetical protein [Haematospirillum sp. 15-248]
MARKPIELGQRFRGVENPRSLWEVEFLYTDGHGVPHARLRNLTTRVDSRTYSCDVISDQRRFRQVELETAE